MLTIRVADGRVTGNAINSVVGWGMVAGHDYHPPFEEVRMEPSKGRIVTYHCTEGERYLGCGDDMTLPAIIVGIVPGVMRGVNLVVFANSTAMLTLRTAVPFGLTSGGWSWPERIAEADPGAAKSVYIEDTKTDAPSSPIPNPISNIQPVPLPSYPGTLQPQVPKVG